MLIRSQEIDYRDELTLYDTREVRPDAAIHDARGRILPDAELRLELGEGLAATPEGRGFACARSGWSTVTLIAEPVRHEVKVRCVLVGGAAPPPALLERAARLGFPVAPTYGLTEAASQVATLRPGRAADPARAALEPLPGTELRVVTAQGGDAAPGEAGEILVRSAAVMRGVVVSARLPGEMREGFVRLGHPVRVLATSHRGAFPLVGGE